MAFIAISLVNTSIGSRKLDFAEANSSEMRINEGRALVSVHSSDQSATPPLVAQNSTLNRETLLASTREYGCIVELVSNNSGACVITSWLAEFTPDSTVNVTRLTA